MGNRKYYRFVDLLRILSCVAVLLYHLGILKGGYLAVCTFFVLTGYLSCINASKNGKINLVDYYRGRIIRIYIPLLLVVFITIAIVPLFSNITWLNLKSETISVLLGYNNYWQLNASLDYFTSHLNSPFIHFWYIGILLQYELIFPFIYIIFNTIKNKINKYAPSIILAILAIISTIYFYIVGQNNSIMYTYYSSLTRIFSFIFGISVGFMNSNVGLVIPRVFQNKNWNYIIEELYIIALIYLFIFVGADSKYYVLAMIGTTIISCRLINYGMLNIKYHLNKIDKLIKKVANITYEVYLIQYPVIFFMQEIDIDPTLRIVLSILLTMILSLLLHTAVNYKKDNKISITKFLVFILLSLVAIRGVYTMVNAKDYNEEMKNLEELLEQNEKVMSEKQKEYEAAIQKQEEELNLAISDFEKAESELKDKIKNMPIVGIGDSVMLGAVKNLYAEFPNGYFDAKVSRTAWVANDILTDLKNKNLLGSPIVFNLGANGDCSSACKNKLLETIGDKKIFWLTVTNDREVKFNSKIESYAKEHDNVYIVDWASVSKGHKEYFYADGLHLTVPGRKAYTDTIFNAIYDVYLKELKTKKEEIINKHEENQKEILSFYGNDLLLNAFSLIHNEYQDSEFIVSKDITYENVIEDINKKIEDNILHNNLIFAFDSSIKMDVNKYEELIKLCKNQRLFIVLTDKELINKISEKEYGNVVILDLYSEIINNNNYLLSDNLHLSSLGNKSLLDLLKNSIN